MKYRKKPVVIEAVQWTGSNIVELAGFAGVNFADVQPEDRGEDPDQTAAVWDKLHNVWVPVYDGCWIIRGVKGEFYPCKPDVFEQTYEQATGS